MVKLQINRLYVGSYKGETRKFKLAEPVAGKLYAKVFDVDKQAYRTFTLANLVNVAEVKE